MSQAPASLARFSPAVRTWFAQALGEPTPIQQRAWEAIAGGKNALVIAPYGLGQDAGGLPLRHRPSSSSRESRGCSRAEAPRLLAQAACGCCTSRRSRPWVPTCSVTLRSRSRAIADLAAAMPDAPAVPQITVAHAHRRHHARRTSQDRAQRHPTSSSPRPSRSTSCSPRRPARCCARWRRSWWTRSTAVAGTKRGAHLSLSLERLDDLLERFPPSAWDSRPRCVRREVVAHFLGGPHAARGGRRRRNRPPSTLDGSVRVPVRRHDRRAAGTRCPQAQGGQGPDSARPGRPTARCAPPWPGLWTQPHARYPRGLRRRMWPAIEGGRCSTRCSAHR